MRRVYMVKSGTKSLAVSIQLTKGWNGQPAHQPSQLQARLEAFTRLQTQPRKGRTAGRAATEELPVYFQKADQILRARLDRLAVQFEESHPMFHKEYRAVRTLVKPGRGRYRATTDNVISVTPEVPEAKAA